MTYRFAFTAFVILLAAKTAFPRAKEQLYNFQDAYMLKFSPLSIVDPYKSWVLPVGVEYTFSSNWAIGVDIGIPVSMIRTPKSRPKADFDFKGRLEVRKYFNSKTDNRGFLGIRAFYRETNYKNGVIYIDSTGKKWQEKFNRRAYGMAFMGGWIVPIGDRQFLEWSGGVAVGGLYAESDVGSTAFNSNYEGSYLGYMMGQTFIGDDWIVYPTMVVKFGVLLGRRNKIFR